MPSEFTFSKAVDQLEGLLFRSSTKTACQHSGNRNAIFVKDVTMAINSHFFIFR